VLHNSTVLVVDDAAEGGFLLVRNLARAMPRVVIHTCKELESAVAWLWSVNVHVVVLHKRREEEAVSFIRAVRSAYPGVVIIAVSGTHRNESVLAAGASDVLEYGNWTELGMLVAQATAERQLSLPLGRWNTARKDPRKPSVGNHTASKSGLRRTRAPSSPRDALASASGAFEF
jgi:DNA-binding NtrC family response regulator